MPTLASILLLLVATVLLAIVPGPDMLYILARSTGQGRSAGIISCIGIASGGCVQTIALALGLSGLFRIIPLTYEIIRYAGACYLIYLGIRTFLSREEILTSATGTRKGLVKIFFQGTLTTLLNPKVAFFYLAFIPQFVNPTQGNISIQLLVLGFIFNVAALAVDCCIALLASLLGGWLKGHTRVATGLRWLSGSVLVALGVRLAFEEK